MTIDTLGYATSGTFPAGGPETAQFSGGPSGGPGGRVGFFGFGGPIGGGVGGPTGAPPVGAPGGGPPARFARPSGGAFAFGPFGGGVRPRGGPFGAGESLKGVLSYIAAHGGGTLAVTSQSSAASAIISEHANVAGIGGFSGRESSVTVAWLAQRVRSGAIRWVLAEGAGGPRPRGDTRTGSQTALVAVAKACRAVQVPASAGVSDLAGGAETPATATVYDCAGRAGALAAAA